MSRTTLQSLMPIIPPRQMLASDAMGSGHPPGADTQAQPRIRGMSAHSAATVRAASRRDGSVVSRSHAASAAHVALAASHASRRSLPPCRTHSASAQASAASEAGAHHPSAAPPVPHARESQHAGNTADSLEPSHGRGAAACVPLARLTVSTVSSSRGIIIQALVTWRIVAPRSGAPSRG